MKKLSLTISSAVLTSVLAFGATAADTSKPNPFCPKADSVSNLMTKNLNAAFVHIPELNQISYDDANIVHAALFPFEDIMGFQKKYKAEYCFYTDANKASLVIKEPKK